MTDLLLAKPKLLEGWLDVSVGEAHVVREALYSVFDIEHYNMLSMPRMEYPYSAGYEPLVKLLEDKYQAPVVITNGAKNALGATMYAMRRMGKNRVGMHSPYWALIPPLLKIHGLDWVCDRAPFDYLGDDDFDSYLCLSPNNPDGHTLSSHGLWDAADFLKEDGIPFIHDAVYHSHVYLPKSYELKQCGDVQIYSASKAFGLSGIRIGWAVCPNPDYYKLIREYMEAMTVGVSILPQVFTYDLMSHMEQHPYMVEQFEDKAAISLMYAKAAMMKVDSEVLEVPQDLIKTPGMFLFCKIKDYSLLEKAKINAIDGKHFGMPGYVRMNLAFNAGRIDEIVARLNATKGR